jgi:hypothetical protein
VSFASGQAKAAVFVVAMLGGMVLFEMAMRHWNKPPSAPSRTRV